MRGSVRSAVTDADACVDVADGGTVETENGAAAAGEIDLRENPGAETDGPMAPVFEEWYHRKISRKEVMRTWSLKKRKRKKKKNESRMFGILFFKVSI